MFFDFVDGGVVWYVEGVLGDDGVLVEVGCYVVGGDVCDVDVFFFCLLVGGCVGECWE